MVPLGGGAVSHERGTPVGSDLELEGGEAAVNYFTEMCSGSEAGSYLRLMDLCITQL